MNTKQEYKDDIIELIPTTFPPTSLREVDKVCNKY